MLARIPDAIDRSKSLQAQARQAHGLRNEARTLTRGIMRNRRVARQLDESDPNLEFDDFVEKIMQDNNYKDLDDAYRHIVNSASKSRSSVDEGFGL